MTKLWTLGIAIVLVASAFMVGCDSAGASSSVKQTTEQPSTSMPGKDGKANNALFPPSDPPPPAEAKGTGVAVGGKAGG